MSALPNTYAHYRFGCDVRRRLNSDIQKIVSDNEELYNIGLQGPDILAFYNPLFKNRLKTLGSFEHSSPVRNLLEYAEKTIRNAKNPNPYLAYMYGVICHFALDCYCHGYVNEKKATTGLGHNLMEAEFDRLLMLRDGHDPFKFRPADTIVYSCESAKTISAVSPKVNEREVSKSIKNMRKWCNFYVAPTLFSRILIYTGLLVSGNFSGKNGMIIKKKRNRKCDSTNSALLRLYKDALPVAVKLISEYRDNVFCDKKYSEVCALPFSPQKPVV